MRDGEAYLMLRKVCMKFLRMSAKVRCGDGTDSANVRLRFLLRTTVLPQLLLVSPLWLLELLAVSVLLPPLPDLMSNRLSFDS